MGDPSEKSPEGTLPPQAEGVSRLGKYSLLRELGRGSMGVVYEAVDTELRRSVALKVLIAPPALGPQEIKPDEERFLAEARLGALLPPHPGIVRVLDSGRIDGKCTIAMDLVKGMSLSEWRKEGSSTIRQHVAILRDVALAVHFAHEHGVVHRDIKPENILVDLDRAPRITDFGLAKAIQPQSPAILSATGVGLGTPYYMSPEQVQGRKDVDRRTDIYSLGVMLYETLAGRRPFEGKTPFEVMSQVLRAPVRPPSKITRLQINPFLYKNLENICLIAMEKEPGDRYSDARSFANDLTRWLNGDDFKVILPKSWRKLRGKRNVRLGLLGLVALGLLGGLASLFHFRPSSGPVRAEPPTLKAQDLGSPEALRRGALAETYLGVNFNARAIRKIDGRADFDDRPEPLWPEAPPYLVSVRWTGLLEVTRSGRYLFETKSSDAIRLVLDGVELLSRWGPRPTTAEEVRCTLERGLHRLTYEHARQGARGAVGLYWKPESSGSFSRLGPGSLLHDPSAAKAPPEEAASEASEPPPEAILAPQLVILEAQGSSPGIREPGDYKKYWRGRGSAGSHLWWGSSVSPGDRLRIGFSPRSPGGSTLVIGLTRASDHGIFRIALNGRPIEERLDLYDAGLVYQEFEYRPVALKPGENELEFSILGSNPSAREWTFGGGVHKIGIAYILVR